MDSCHFLGGLLNGFQWTVQPLILLIGVEVWAGLEGGQPGMQLATASSRDTCKPASREIDRVWDKGRSVGFGVLWFQADSIERRVPKRALGLRD